MNANKARTSISPSPYLRPSSLHNQKRQNALAFFIWSHNKKSGLKAISYYSHGRLPSVLHRISTEIAQLMLSNLNAPIVLLPNHASDDSDSDARNSCSSQLNSLSSFHASVKRDHEVTGRVCGCADQVIDDRLPNKLIGTLANHSLAISRTLSGTITHGSDTVDRLSSQSRNLVKHSQASVSDDGHEGTAIFPQPNKAPVVATILSRILAFFTMYGELCVALTPEEFGSVRVRLQQEWTFDGGFLLGLSAVNTAMFAITADSIFKVDSYACTAVAISSAACGLGIACDIWFQFRYSWVDLGTFINRSRDVYGSYVFFSLSSRMPTFCTLISSVSLMFFLGLVAYDARPVGVIVIGVLVILVMILQFIVYGTHHCAKSALRVWRAGAVRASEV